MHESYKPAVPYFLDCLKNPNEAPIVRHEILITLGLLIDDISLIEPFLEDPDFVVKQSCEAAINQIKCRLENQYKDDEDYDDDEFHSSQ